jgi:sigma-E factor negative regulatory protein RseB
LKLKNSSTLLTALQPERRRWLRQTVGFAPAVMMGLAGLPLWAHAGGIASAPQSYSSPTQIWLRRVNEASQRLNFSGTFGVHSGQTKSSARIIHISQGGQQYEYIESLDGPHKQIYRHNQRVHTFWPEHKTVQMEDRQGWSAFPALLHTFDGHLSDHYVLQAMGEERLAGLDAQMSLLLAKDSHRYSHRLWTEKKRGLLLRVDVLNERQEVLESSAFSELRWEVPMSAETLLSGMNKSQGYRQIKPEFLAINPQAQGWQLPREWMGFYQVRCFLRTLEDAFAHQKQGKSTHKVLQAIYSDGLTYMSIFVEPLASGTLLADSPSHSQIGATQTWTTRQRDWQVTVVGEVPVATLRAIASALQRVG